MCIYGETISWSSSWLARGLCGLLGFLAWVVLAVARAGAWGRRGNWSEILGRGLLQWVTGRVLSWVAHRLCAGSRGLVMDYTFNCEQCGADCGVVCRVCVSCPEPAGYWGMDRETARDYLITLERAAARESDPEIVQTLIAHHAVMSTALGITEEGE